MSNNVEQGIYWLTEEGERALDGPTRIKRAERLSLDKRSIFEVTRSCASCGHVLREVEPNYCPQCGRRFLP